jgi:hypothetical protein
VASMIDGGAPIDRRQAKTEQGNVPLVTHRTIIGGCYGWCQIHGHVSTTAGYRYVSSTFTRTRMCRSAMDSSSEYARSFETFEKLYQGGARTDDF